MDAMSAARNREGEGETKAGDDEAVEGAGAGFDAAARSLERRPQIGQAGLDIGRRGDDRRQRRARPLPPPCARAPRRRA